MAMRLKLVVSVLVVLIIFTTFLPLILVPRHDVAVPKMLTPPQGRPLHTTKVDSSHISLVSIDLNETNSNTTKFNSYHFVVSSGCRRYQWWQVITQIHSARSVGQRGRYTWIVSGCPKEKIDKGDSGTTDDLAKVFEAHFSASSQEDLTVSKVHFTPDFSNMSVYGGPYADGKTKRTFLNRRGEIQHGNYGNHYHFNNKPNGLRHWAEGHRSELQKDTNEAIVLIDPDFLFLTPFQLPVQVPPGQPAAASYGLGAQWLEFNVSAICGKDSPCTRTTRQQVRRHYSVGPPYIIHANDVLRLATQWCKLVPPTYDQYPLLYAEMFAYSMAAAHLELKHNLLNGLFTGCMVGWPESKKSGDAGPSARAFVTSGADVKVPALEGPSSCFLPPLQPPSFLHYCRRYAFVPTEGKASYYFVAKRRVPDDILDCDNPTQFLTPFPSNENEKIYGRDANWTTLTVCSIVRPVNYARNSHCHKMRN